MGLEQIWMQPKTLQIHNMFALNFFHPLAVVGVDCF